jgi:hypothetical protein
MVFLESRDPPQNGGVVDTHPTGRAGDGAGFGHSEHESQVIPIEAVHE